MASHTSLVILITVKVSMVIMASGEPCVFPFLYGGKEHYDCTTEKHERPWCSFTYSYEKRWRDCDSASSWSVSYNPQSICALEGSTVDMSCSYTHPSHLTVQKAYWINSLSDAAPDISQQIQYNNRVGVNCGDKNCSLQINSVKYSDEGHYYCRITTNVKEETQIGTHGVQFSVTGLQVVSSVKGTEVKEGDHVTLTCNTTCSLTGSPSFIWSKDGRPVEKKQIINNQLQLHSVSYEDEGNYTCAVRGHEDLPSPSERLSVIYPPQRMQIQISPSGEITEGNRVTLTCMSEANPPVHTYTWIKKSGAVELKSGEEKTLTFSNIRSADTGEYLCQATNGIGQQDSSTMSVQVLYPPQNTRVFTSHSGVITKGTIVNLTCRSDANPPVENYTWFKVGESTPVGSGQQYSITYISSEDGGQYYCEARNKYGAENSTAVPVEVQSSVMVTVVAVSVSVCGVLGLICAAVWMRFHRKGGRTQREDGTTHATYKNNPQDRKSGDFQMRSVYQNLDLKTNQTDEGSENQDPKMIQPDEMYQVMDPNTIQPDNIYENIH